MNRLLLGSLLITICSGCGTFYNQEYGRKPYGGVVDTYETATESASCGSIGSLMFLDMPFSLVGDTLFLPFDLYYQHRVRADRAHLKRLPQDVSPLEGWKNTVYFQKKPHPEIVADYESYIEQLPPDQHKGWVSAKSPVKIFENGTGAHAAVINLWLTGKLWQHILFYDEANRRVKVMKYSDGHYYADRHSVP